MKNPLLAITKQLLPKRRNRIEQAVKVTAGTAAGIWMVLRLRRELYGPGGTRMSRYDRTVDDVWKRES